MKREEHKIECEEYKIKCEECKMKSEEYNLMTNRQKIMPIPYTIRLNKYKTNYKNLFLSNGTIIDT